MRSVSRAGWRVWSATWAGVVAWIGVAAGPGPAGVTAAEPELQAGDLPHFPPVEPAQALGTFQVRPGFRLEWAAHEPEVMDPIAASFDEQGRVYVVEMRDYSERRPERLGRIRRLEDRDGDGRFESSVVFFEGLPWPTAVTCWEGGVFVGATPDLWYARDEDGDGRADVRERVFTGFASDSAPYETNRLNVQAMFNSFQWGLDNRIHGASGLAGGKVRRVDSPFVQAWRKRAGSEPAAGKDRAGEGDGPFDVRGRDFSFDPRTLEFRLETGGGQYGMTFDDAGRKYLCSNSDHLQVALYEDRYTARNPFQTLPSPRASIAADGPAAPVFRLSPDEPWRVIRTRWRVTGLVPGLIEGGGRVSGYFTSATGLTIYRGDAYGPAFAGDAFVADCGSNLVHRKKIRALGCDRVGERPADEQGREFLASRDTWFRPVQFVNAPDGCLWVIDMYREIIEHPWSLPPNLKRLMDLNAGNDRGRLLRMVPEGAALRRRVDLSGSTTPELVALLGHANGWHRDTAARLLFQRRDPASVSLLIPALRSSPQPLARLHALYALDGLGQAGSEVLATALRDGSPEVRAHAIRLVELRLGGAPLPAVLVEGLAAAAQGEAPVRLQLALSLGNLEFPGRTELLSRLLVSVRPGAGEDLIGSAVLASAGDEAERLFVGGTASMREGAEPPPTLAALAEMLGRRQRRPEIEAALAALAALRPQAAGVRLAARLGDGLRRAGGEFSAADRAGALAPLLAYARGVAAGASPTAAGSGEGARSEAVRLLGHLPPGEMRDVARPLLVAGIPVSVQRAAVEELLRRGDRDNIDLFFGAWSGLAPEARQVGVDGLMQRPGGMSRVLSAVEARQVAPRDLAAGQLNALRGSQDAAVRARALALLGAPAASREEAVAAVLPALNLKGDLARGRAVVEAQCLTCHRLGGVGHALGPDLESVRSQPKEKLLVAIVDPNREVAPNYLATSVETTDHESVTGLAGTETAAGLVIRQAAGVETQIPRAKMLEVRAEGRSVMPEGFESTLTPQALADLLALLTGEP